MLQISIILILNITTLNMANRNVFRISLLSFLAATGILPFSLAFALPGDRDSDEKTPHKATSKKRSHGLPSPLQQQMASPIPTGDAWKARRRKVFGDIATKVNTLDTDQLAALRKRAASFGIRITQDRALQLINPAPHSPQAGDLAVPCSPLKTAALKTAKQDFLAPLSPMTPIKENALLQKIAAGESPVTTVTKHNGKPATYASPRPRAAANLESPQNLLRKRFKNNIALKSSEAFF